MIIMRLFVFLPLCLFSVQTYSDRRPYSGEYKVERITTYIYALLNLYSPKGGVNAAFMATDTSLIFIDAGMNMDSAEAIWSEATKLFPGRATHYLVLSHFHSDHVFGMAYFKNRGAKVIGHKSIDSWLNPIKFSERITKKTGKGLTFVDVMSMENYSSAEVAKRILGDVTLSSPDLFIESDEILHLDDLKLNLYHVPGHTPDLIAVYEPRSQTLVASDLIYSQGEPFLHDKTKQGYEAWGKSLARMNELPIQSIIPGHGSVCDKAMIDKNIRSLQEQAQSTKD